MDKTDELLWHEYSHEGLQTSFEALFHRYKGKIFNFSLRLVGSRADAEDVTSEVFVQLFNKRFQDDGRAKLSTWLFTVARNASLTRLRSGRHTVSLWFKSKEDDSDQAWDVPDKADSPEEAARKKETARLVRSALTRLPVEQREALILREYFGKDYAEIAAILECSLEKVKVLIFRGREHLRKELGSVKEQL